MLAAMSLRGVDSNSDVVAALLNKFIALTIYAYCPVIAPLLSKIQNTGLHIFSKNQCLILNAKRL